MSYSFYKVNKIMIYRYCPFCGSEYNRDSYKKYPNQIECPSCEVIFYNNPKPAVAGLIFKGEEILLTKRKNNPFKGYWDMPGGFMNYGEVPRDALRRELKEELNVEISKMEIIGSFDILYPTEKGDNFSVCVLVFKVILENKILIKAGDDVTDYSLFNKKNIPNRIAFDEQKDFLLKIMNNTNKYRNNIKTVS